MTANPEVISGAIVGRQRASSAGERIDPPGRPHGPENGNVVALREPPGFRFDVALVGLGYVGLPTALAFHAADCSVLGLDTSTTRNAAIGSRKVDLLESDHDRLRAALRDHRRFALTENPARLAEARAVIVAVPTPVDDHLLPDLSILRAACASVVEHAVPGQVIILTSTTYVGSTREMLVAPLQERGFVVGEDICVAG